MTVQISYRFGFDAAHHFDHYPEGHPNRGMHGHSFEVEVAIEGEPDPATGFVADLGDVEAACADVRRALDHKVLNDVGGLGPPSLENLCRWIWRRLKPRYARLCRITVRRESARQSCTYAGD